MKGSEKTEDRRQKSEVRSQESEKSINMKILEV